MTALEIRHSDGIGGGVRVPTIARSPDLEGLAASWLLGIRGRNTRVNYARDLRGWVEWCQAHDLDPLAAERGHVDGWVAEQLDQGAAPASVKRRLVAVRSFYDHLVHDAEVLARNPAARVQPPRVYRPPTIPKLSADQIRAMAELAAHEGPTFELAYRLLATCALRVSEACGLRVADIGRAPDGTLVGMIRGKGDKQRVAVFTGRTAALVLAACEHEMVRASESGELRLVRATVRTVERRVKAWGAIVAPGVPITPHVMRHAAATILAGVDGVKLEDRQDFLGHADPRTTRHYDRDAGAVDRNPSRHLEALLPQTPPAVVDGH